MACKDKNPLMREGTDLVNRALNALQAAYVKPDERTAADIMLFVRRYAALVNYYNNKNAPDGHWDALMKMDVSVSLALLQSVEIKKCAEYKSWVFNQIKSAADDVTARQQFVYLFDLAFSLVEFFVKEIDALPPAFDDKLLLETIVNTSIKKAAQKLKVYYDFFKTEGLIVIQNNTDTDAPLLTNNADKFHIEQMGQDWDKNLPVVDITIPATLTVKEKIVYLINHNLFVSRFDNLLNVIGGIVARSSTAFDDSIQQYPAHTPHYALFIAFVKLFRHAQDELNKYTQRHLGFYYKEVLQLSNKNAQPDNAHLLFELAKPVSKHLLKKGTLLKAGKDPVSNNEMQFALTDDVLINKAAVTSLKAVQVYGKDNPLLFAYPVADSEDGEGAKLLSADKSWYTFGNSNNGKDAGVGFAIASNLLFLKEGERNISVSVSFVTIPPALSRLLNVSPQPLFTAALTGKKDWVTKDAFVSAENNKLIFTVALSPDDMAIVPYDEKLHKTNFNTTLPLLKILLRQGSDHGFCFSDLSSDAVANVAVTVTVKGARDLMLSSDAGAIDASKPFKPYGDFPDDNASFYIGSKEIFQKKLTSLKLNYEGTLNNSSDLQYLHQGKWKTATAKINNDQITTADKIFPPATMDFLDNEALTATTLNGFIRLRLNSPSFSKGIFIENVVKAVEIKQSASIDPKQAYLRRVREFSSFQLPKELQVEAFSIDYTANATVSLADDKSDERIYLYHLYPFGYAGVAFSSGDKMKRIPLLPVFENAGELYIGLSAAEPGDVINILFQAAEGTSNPLKDAEKLNWYYLTKQNEWLPFGNDKIIDNSNGFLQPGIVTVELPGDASNQCTLLPTGTVWIKAAVAANPDAVCKMILVKAQAAKAVLQQSEEKNIAFRKLITANTISKLVTGDSSIRAVTQPFDSFGGRIKEADEKFYTRVSERLRHKQRSITIWDYEHILLEQFPEIYKIKCINHSGFYKVPNSDDVFCENFAGHVTIIPIIDLKDKSGINLLRPYTPVGLLKRMEDYLKEISSPFINIHVKNPQFEEVQFEFEVSFQPNLDDAFYTKLLNEELQQFLTPWVNHSAAAISFGGKIIKSQVLNFIEERSYVDYVTCFKMHQVIRRKNELHVEEKRDIEVAEPSTARSILVSYYNEFTGKAHLIQSPANCSC